MTKRAFDVVVYGATGFAGRLVAEYLQDQHADLRWAIAGRSEAKLESLADDLAARAEGGRVPILVADSQDPASLVAMAAQTRVICTTVGPYAKYGAPVVEAAVAHGTHCCDLTGEPQFIRRMIDAHHEQAQAAGTRIVHCCGFDSIPSDLGVLLLQTTALERDGGPCDEVEFIVKGMSGGMSGGTLASMGHVFDEASDPAVRRVLADPYSLASTRGPDGRAQMGARYSQAAGAWTGPFLMAAINERVVRRSNALLDHLYGADFRYSESVQTGRGMKGRLTALGMGIGFGAAAGALAIGPLRRRILPRLTPPGEGPTRAQIENGWFAVRLFGKRQGEVVLTVDVKGQRDPGYGATACMLGESAVLLASDAELGVTGICTPASALGTPLIERLHATQVQFDVS